MADNQEQRKLKQIYLNGKPYLVYDDIAENRLDKVEVQLSNISKILSILNDNYNTNFDNGSYVGSLKYITPSEKLDGKIGTSIEGSLIPFFDVSLENSDDNPKGYSTLTIDFY